MNVRCKCGEYLYLDVNGRKKSKEKIGLIKKMFSFEFERKDYSTKFCGKCGASIDEATVYRCENGHLCNPFDKFCGECGDSVMQSLKVKELI